MKHNLENRIAKLEVAMQPPPVPPCILRTFADQCGKDGESIRRETDKESIAKHLATHPEDADREFDFHVISLVHGQWNDRGEFVCNEPGCSLFSTVRNGQHG